MVFGLLRQIDYNQVNINQGTFLQDFRNAYRNGILSLNAGQGFNPAYNANIPGSVQLPFFSSLTSGGLLTNTTVRSDILSQFLIEALTISFLGGLTGILFGFVVSRTVALYAEWSTVVTGASIAMSFGVAASVGLIFGIYPAVRASRLNPVEALRYE